MNNLKTTIVLNRDAASSIAARLIEAGFFVIVNPFLDGRVAIAVHTDSKPALMLDKLVAETK